MKTNIIATIRNKFAFHYDLAEIRCGFQRPSSEEDWNIYLAESNGNTLYYASELAANHALLNSVVPDNPKAALELLIDELIRVGNWFIVFLSSCLIVLTERHLLNHDGNLEVEEILLQDVPQFADVTIPYYVSLPGRDDA